MSPTSITCAICGAKISHHPKAQISICAFCKFEHHRYFGPTSAPIIPHKNHFEDIPYLLRIDPVAKIHIDGGKNPIYSPEKYPVDLIALTPDHIRLKAIWSEMLLPFQQNLAEYFNQKFHQLIPGGLLYLSTPVNRAFRKTSALPGQINSFTSKNIMFLLEHHGFNLIWRKNRFAPILRIIARK